MRCLASAEYSSLGVRECTAELASYALTESTSVSQGHSPQNRAPSHISARDELEDFPEEGTSDASGRLTSRPDVIQEASEPPSPTNAFSTFPSRSKNSILSRPFASPSNDEVHGHQQHQSPHAHKEDTTDENTPLLHQSRQPATKQDLKDVIRSSDLEGQNVQPEKVNKFQQLRTHFCAQCDAGFHVAINPKRWDPKSMWQECVQHPLELLPCVFLGTLLNVLDALSYGKCFDLVKESRLTLFTGIILFPLGEPVFAKTGADGISMFYISCIVSQLVYSCGGSIFKGAIGSEMVYRYLLVPNFNADYVQD